MKILVLSLMFMLAACDDEGSLQMVFWGDTLDSSRFGVYLGDGQICSFKNEGALKYMRNKNLALCQHGHWTTLRIVGVDE